MNLLITGGAGFIGSALVRAALDRGHAVINYDALTYAANLDNLAGYEGRAQYSFVGADIRDGAAVAQTLQRFQPDAIVNLAAESHVDRSIDGPAPFIETNIIGVFTLLEAARAYFESLPEERQARFRFHQVSTDEVFGSLGPEGRFDEESAYRPNSPYSASKASADMLVRAWGRTYGLPVLISNCSNNYGPFQFPEKLIPVVILAALEGRPIPVYGEGRNVRDWLYVEDHAEALLTILERGRPGEVYAVGGDAEVANIELVRRLCALMDEAAPKAHPHADLITFTPDRPGHDLRYAVDAGKVARELGWRPRTALEEGLQRTVRWYLDHPGWWGAIRARGHDGRRLGLGLDPVKRAQTTGIEPRSARSDDTLAGRG